MILNYRNYLDLSNCIKSNIHKIQKYDLFVGVPRSGLLVANLMALLLNKPVCTVQEMANGLPPQNGFSRKIDDKKFYNNVLVVDDSVNTGKSINYVKEIFKNKGIDADYCAVYSTSEAIKHVDIVFEIVEKPRIFQWNYFNNSIINSSAVLFEHIFLSGIKCPKNTNELECILTSIQPVLLKNVKIGMIFTGYNKNAADLIINWLNKYNIEFNQVLFCDSKNLFSRIDYKYFKEKKSDFSKIKLMLLGSDYLANKVSSLLNVPCMSFNDKLF